MHERWQLFRAVCWFLVVGGLTANASAADEFAAPPKAERDLFSAIAKRGGRAQVDGEYRILSITLGTECTNDELKGLAACERLTSITINSPKITDVGLEQLQGLSKLTSILITASGTTTEGVAKLRTALPNCRVTSFGRGGGFTGGQFGGGFNFNSLAGGASTGASGSPLSLLRNTSVQDDLKLTPEQRTKIADATGANTLAAFMKAADEKAQALLSPEQQARMKQLLLQQAGVTVIARDDIAKQLQLSSEQVAAIRKQYDEMTVAAQAALREINAQPAADPAATAERSAKAQAKSEELAKQREVKILSLLNEEQRKAWQAMVGPKGPDLALFSSGRGRSRAPTDLATAAKAVFDRYDMDKDGRISEIEFPATNRTRAVMTAAGIKLEFPLTLEAFTIAYGKYLEVRGGPRGPSRVNPTP